jgi:AGCS family alanine or glycine:cation symporter
MQEIVNTLDGLLWSTPLIYLCLGTGLFFSFKTRFLQLRLIKEMWRLLFAGKSSKNGISSFQALSISLSGRVGTGNIAGVAAAIGFGGPGAVFWMWVVAFFGSATAYIEATNAQIYKEVDEGCYRGGPAYYIEKAMGQKWYAWIFAIATIFACGLLLPTIQSNAIGNAMEMVFTSGQTIDTFIGQLSVVKLVTACIIVVMLGGIIFGGVKRIAHFTEVVVPFMALAYILIACAIVLLDYQRIPEIFALIIGDAFSPMAGFGAAIGWGIKRGVYSNEAGQGTAPHAAAAAEVEHPAQQGLVQAFSVYIDTLFVCTATAFMILITHSYNVHGVGEEFIVQNLAANIDASTPAFTQVAMESVFAGFGNPFVAVALFFFAFTTLLAYYFILEQNVVYLNRHYHIHGLGLLVKLVIIAATFYGTIKEANLAWGLGNIGVGLMAWLNIIGIVIIFFMAKPAIKALRDYEEQKKRKVDNYSFDPEKLGINNAGFWVDRLKNKDNN